MSVRGVSHRLCDPVRDRLHGANRGFRGTVGSLERRTRCDVAQLPGRLGDLVGHSLNFRTTAQSPSPRLHTLVGPSTSIRPEQETGDATKQQCGSLHSKDHLSLSYKAS